MSSSNPPPVENNIILAINKKFTHSGYTLIKQIGQGGFAQVFGAKNNKTTQMVAIKIITINPDYNEEKRRRYIQRFEREAMLGGCLLHPNIVRLLDEGRCGDDLLYAVFEYVDGDTLKDHLFKYGPLSPSDAADVMAQVLDGLVHAHQQGIIHRDIKPANIMLTKVGAKTHVKILDFGIGALSNEVRHLDYKTITLTGETLGTPSYCAPEQLRGEPPTPKTDIYVWGLVLIECLTGMPAINGSNIASILQKQLSPSNVPLPAGVLGHPLGDFLRRVLNKRLDERSDDTEALYDTFTRLNFYSLVGDLKYSTVLAEEIQNSDRTIISGNVNFDSNLTEKKQITVLSITLSSYLVEESNMQDIDIFETLYRDRQAQCIDIAVRFGAVHAGTLADTLLFYFGFPLVSDNDARLCARTSLEIVSVLRQRNEILSASQSFFCSVKMGIHTGIVSVYEDALPEGNTANLAMELSRAAGCNQILCSEVTRKLLDNHIEFQAHKITVGGEEARNFSAYAIKSEKTVEAFGFLRANMRSHSFIGRAHELTLLEELLDRPQASFAHVYGEAGIGKSRIIFELRNNEKKHSHYVVQCLPEYRNNAFYPILNLLEQKYSLALLCQDKGVDRLRSVLLEYTKSDKYIGDGSIDERLKVDVEVAIPILCVWLNYDLLNGREVPELSPERMKDILFYALVILLCAKNSSDAPIQSLFVFEDIHWADDVSLAWIDYLLTSALFIDKDHSVITTSREPIDREKGVRLKIEKFEKSDLEDFVCKLFQNNPVANDLLTLISDRTDGIPLFVEEVVAMLKNKKLVDMVNGKVSITEPAKMEVLPTSLRDSLQQSLDELSTSKNTAQLASILGRRFSYSILQECSTLTDIELQRDIDELVVNAIVIPKRSIQGLEYWFRHALIRDAAYNSLMPRERGIMHGSVAYLLEKKQNETGFEHEICAFHFYQAGVYGKAAHYWRQSGNRSVDLGDNPNAVRHYNAAIEAVDKLPPDESIINQEIDIRKALGIAYCATRGFASEEVAKNQIELDEKIAYLNDEDKLFGIFWTSAVANIVQAKYEESKPALRKLLEMAESDTTHEKIFPAYLLKIGVEWQTGNFTEAKTYGESAIALYQYENHNHLSQVYSYDPGIAIIAVHALVVWALGEYKQCEAYCEQALLLSKKRTDPVNLAHTLVRISQANVLERNFTKALDVALETIDLSEQYGLGLWLACADVIKVWAQSHLKKHSDQKPKINELEASYQNLAATGTIAHSSWYLSLIAEACMNYGYWTKAGDNIDAAIATALRTGDTLYLAETYRLKIEILERKKSTLAESDEIKSLVESTISLIREQNSNGFIRNFSKGGYFKHTEYLPV